MFNTGKPVTGKDFIDRKKHLPLFKTYIDNNQNIMIKAPRRFGKTSIVKHILENKQEYDFIYIDINKASNLKSLANIILDSAYKLSGIDNFIYRTKNSLYELINSMDNIKASIPEFVELSFKFNQDKEDFDDMEYYLHSLDVLNAIANKQNINVKCVFDEFQDILKIATKDILNKSRSVMQHHEYVSYIFLGSIETIMTKIFEHKSSAFFHFTRVITLPALDVDELYKYTNKVFDDKEIKCENLIDYLNYLGGHPDYSMQFLQKVYLNSLAYGLKNITKQKMNIFMLETIYDNKAYITELINNAKTKKHHLDILNNMANDEKSTVDGKSLYNIRNSLEDMGLIRNISQGKYEIIDIFLKFLLSQKETKEIENFSIYL